MRHVVIGTAGHVDHGKTTLVHALTGVQTDRLPEEQRRGITIELGFAPWALGDDLRASVIDAPGHRKLVHHMIAGASGIDLVLLVVAASDGVMPQTREHVAACKLLGVRHVVVAVTKVDLVDEDLAELAAEETTEMLTEQGFETAAAVLCSAKDGTGVDALREAVTKAVDDVVPPERGHRVRLSVDRVFAVKGAGTVVTGTLVEGTLRLGSQLRVIGPDHEHEASARGLQVHGEAREEAEAPTRLAINLGGVSQHDVSRGDVITDDADARPTRILDVWLQALEPLRRGAEASLHLGTARSVAKIQPVGQEQLEGDGYARLRLHAPLIAVGGDRFVLRGARIDGPSGAILGGGIVLDAAAPRHVRAAKREEVLSALHLRDAGVSVEALVAEAAPQPLRRDGLASRFAVGARALTDEAAVQVKAGDLVEVADGWVRAADLAAMVDRGVDAVRRHHEDEPLDPGLPRATLRERFTSRSSATVAEAALAVLEADPRLAVDGDALRLVDFRGAAGDADAQRALETVGGALEEAGLSGITEHAATELLAGDVKRARAVLAALVRTEAAVVAGGLWFAAPEVTSLIDRVVAHLRAEGRLTIATLKEMTDLGRRQCIPLLEHLDREGYTRRDGSDRLPGPRLD